MMAMYLVFAVTLVVAGALDDDSQVSIQSQSGRIIDIKASVQKGAKLLGGAEVESNEACVQECMGSESCDLAVYKMSGLSKSGRNCYMVACAMEKTCVTAEHHDFVANFILQAQEGKDDKENVIEEDDDEEADDEETDDEEADDEEADDEEADDEEADDEEADDEEADDKEADDEEADDDDEDETVEADDNEDGTVDEEGAGNDENKEGGEEKSATEDADSDTESVKEDSNSEETHDDGDFGKTIDVEENENLNDADEESNAVKDDTSDSDADIQETLEQLKDEFTKLGSDDEVKVQSEGAGPVDSSSSSNTVGIAVGSVIGGLFVVVVIALGIALIAKKGYDGFKRRKYKKMDYLINGMYS